MSSWFKRVESLLESVDKSAAAAIGTQKDENEATTSPTASYHAAPTSTNRAFTPTAKGRTSITPPPPPTKMADDDIFKFLNDDSGDAPAVAKLAMPVAKPAKAKKEAKTIKKTVPTSTPNGTPTHTPAPTPTPTSVLPPSTPTTSTPSSPSLTSTPLPPLSLPSTSSTSPRKPLTPPSPIINKLELEPQPQHKLELDPHIQAEPTPPSPKLTSSQILEKQEPETTPPPNEEQNKEEETIEAKSDGKEEDTGDAGELPERSSPYPPATPSPIPTEDSESVHEEPSQGLPKALEEETSAGDDSATTPNESEVGEGNVGSQVTNIQANVETEDASEERSDEIAGGHVDATQPQEVQKEEEEEEEAEEEEEEAEEEGGLDAEFVQKYNDMITENARYLRENKLMRAEVVKLHEEINSLTNKCRSTSDALSQVSELLSEHQKMAHEKEKQLVKMMQQEQELETALQAKDMQQSGIRAQYEQLEKTLRLREQSINTYQDRIEKLTQEKEALLDGNQRNAEHIQDKLEELEKFLMEEKRQHVETQRLAKEHEAELQAGMAEYTKALAGTQRNLDEKTLELTRSMVVLKEAQNEAKSLRQELVDYKIRATKVLQSKEKTIQELTDQMAEGGGSGTGKAMANLGELLRAQQERDTLQQERDELSHTVDQLRSSFQEMQSQAEADSEVFRTQLTSVEESLEREKKRVQALQIDLLTRSNESAHAQSEAERALVELQDTVKAKDVEIAKLRKQSTAKTLSSSTQLELENRLRSTTEHLLTKQAQIDSLLSEKSFLQLQLEQRQNSVNSPPLIKRGTERTAKGDHVPISIKTSGDVEDEEPRLRQRSIASALVPPSRLAQPDFVSKRVVGAANFLDKMSASLGRVLRNQPLARLGVIVYIVMIHLMGFYMMAVWNPEIHHDGMNDMLPPGK